MNWEITEPFSGTLPIFRMSVSDWDRKKKELLKLHSDSSDLHNEDHYTDFFANEGNEHYVSEFFQIMKEELSSFNEAMKELYPKVSGLGLDLVWTQKYNKSQDMGPHTHGAGKFAAVLYVEFTEEHKATEFQAPYLDFLSGNIISRSPVVKEGDLIIFPSYLVHYASPNK